MSSTTTSLASHRHWQSGLTSITSLVDAYLMLRELSEAPPVAILLGGSLVIGVLVNLNLLVFKQYKWAGRKLVIEGCTMKSYVHGKLLREVTIEGLTFDVSGLEPAMRDGALFRILDRSGHTFAEFGGSPAMTGLRTFLREGVRLGAVLRATAIDVEELRRETHCLALRRMAWAIPFLITGGIAFAYTLPHAGQPWAKLLNLLGSLSTLFAAGALGLAILDRFRSTESFATLAAPFELYPQDLRTRIQLEQDVWYRTCRVRSYKVLQRALFWGSWLYFVIPITLIVDPDSWRDPSETFGVLLLTLFGRAFPGGIGGLSPQIVRQGSPLSAWPRSRVPRQGQNISRAPAQGNEGRAFGLVWEQRRCLWPVATVVPTRPLVPGTRSERAERVESLGFAARGRAGGRTAERAEGPPRWARLGPGGERVYSSLSIRPAISFLLFSDS